jgi:hypothetical protein
MIYNPYPSIELPFGKDNKYFMQLFDAICMVNKIHTVFCPMWGRQMFLIGINQ